MNSAKRDESVASGAKQTLLCIRGHLLKRTKSETHESARCFVSCVGCAAAETENYVTTTRV